VAAPRRVNAAADHVSANGGKERPNAATAGQGFFLPMRSNGKPAMRLQTARRLMTPSARSDVPPFMVMDVMAAAARIEATGGRVVHMEVGQPAVGAPSPAIATAQAALGSGRPLGYTESLGIASLRARIARHYAETYRLPVSAERVIVTTGSSAGFILAFLSLFEPGDRVAIASPGYPPYRHILRALGCEPVLIETSAATRFAVTGESLRAAHARTPLAGVLVASPANPTGTMMEPQALADLIGAAESEGIRFISDEIYHGLDYAMPAETALRFSDNVVVINSFSKYFCMTGWRIGWMVVPEVMVRPIDRLQGNLAISVPTLSQIAAEAAFEGRAELDAIKHGYEGNRKILIEGLPKAGLDRFLPVDGAFYLYADISKFSDDSVAFTKSLLEDAHVAATPGVDFDPVHGSEFVRFSYAGSAAEMREAVERIGNWLPKR
jgi:aspartate/methionine/tyrosine aminotransferase